MADAVILTYWATAWGAFALWAWRIDYRRRGAGETSRRCRGVTLWTAEGRAE